MPAARLSEEQKTAVLGQYQAGIKLSVIASEFRVHESYPVVLAKRRGFVARSFARPGNGLESR